MADFEDTYEMNPHDMNAKQFKIAVIGKLNGINERLDTLNGKVACVERHKTYFKAIWWLIGIFGLGIIGTFVKIMLGG